MVLCSVLVSQMDLCSALVFLVSLQEDQTLQEEFCPKWLIEAIAILGFGFVLEVVLLEPSAFEVIFLLTDALVQELAFVLVGQQVFLLSLQKSMAEYFVGLEIERHNLVVEMFWVVGCLVWCLALVLTLVAVVGRLTEMFPPYLHLKRVFVLQMQVVPEPEVWK